MMKLTAQARQAGASLETLRQDGFVPAVCNGNGESVVISLLTSEFLAVYKEAGTSSIIELDGAGDESKDVLIKEIQRHPVSEEILHVEFYATTKGEAIEASVPLVFEGLAPAEKAGASISKVLREVNVVSLPRDLPSEIVVDMTAMTNVGDNILVKDLVLPANVTVTEDPEEAVVTSSVAQEIVEEEAPTEIDMSAIESEQKGKGEEEESAE